MAKVKEVSSYSGSAWGTAVPIGANATNIDMASNPSDYDSSSTETSTAIINTNDVKVISSDTDLTAWGKFNRFRKRVSNAFGTLSGKTLATAYTTASADSKIYSASVLNTYMTNVIGYTTGTATPSEGTVASQLSLLNNNDVKSLKPYAASGVGMGDYSIFGKTSQKIGFVICYASRTEAAGNFTIATLPEGYRPLNAAHYFMAWNSNHGYILRGAIMTNGIIEFINISNTGTWSNLYFNTTFSLESA